MNDKGEKSMQVDESQQFYNNEIDDVHKRNIMSFSNFFGIDVMSMKSTSSSQGSIIFIPENENLVYQYFYKNEVAKRIMNIFSHLYENPYIEYKLKLSKGYGRHSEILLDESLEYNIFDYITRLEFNVDNMIVWKKIYPLNMLNKDRLAEFVELNIIKLLWDIGKALYGIHKKGIIHNDCRIDNIGIDKNLGNFVLFDFDGSVRTGDRNIYEDIDYKTLKESINFVLNSQGKYDEMLKVGVGGTLMKTLVIYISTQTNKSRKEVYDYLDNLQIQYTTDEIRT